MRLVVGDLLRALDLHCPLELLDGIGVPLLVQEQLAAEKA